MLRFHRTSLLDAQTQTVVNTVNTVGVMGKGLAKEFKIRRPQMYEAYKEICDQGALAPGQSWLWRDADQWVLNFATKAHWRNPSKLEWIAAGLDEFRARFAEWGVRDIAFPCLGCGNGGLDWKTEVQPLMIEKLSGLSIDVYIHDFHVDIGAPEHEYVMEGATAPLEFSLFLDHIRHAAAQNDGVFALIRSPRSLSVTTEEVRGKLRLFSEGASIASEDDLFRIWQMLLETPVSGFEMPPSATFKPLAAFSVLSSLPYIDAVNVAKYRKSAHMMRPYLAIKMRRDLTPRNAVNGYFAAAV